MYQSFRNNKGGDLPVQFDAAHDLCLLAHDLMLQLIKDGGDIGVFNTQISLNDRNDKVALEQAPHLLDWLEQTGRVAERRKVLIGMVFPAVLSDMLSCIYEALECSRKGKLSQALILIDREGFAQHLSDDPLKLRPKNSGGLPGHTKRIEAVLDVIEGGSRFEAAYIAQIRYDKTDLDSFDGICNKAMHLFTEHPAIRTEQMNVNFVFSDLAAKNSQWSFLYSRLPYLLLYLQSLVEHISLEFSTTTQEYREDVNRRLIALLSITWAATDFEYWSAPLERCASQSWNWLTSHCSDKDFPFPEPHQLERMAHTGALPGESDDILAFRRESFIAAAQSSRNMWLRKDRH
jgi:hypothetical protein